ncbi:nicotinate-nucleotide adenylyltransferase [Corynebacterium sp. 320]|uniref:Probable nicotinate-nucleotide adenylyltransferase n=1 Tax=Corynebacterium zhongnanshanii TaxID=2768834 RepID=A0ABQ6VDS3_9CORY|nr:MULTISPECIES: nicotinate-nucleotide adenylyltransferase [Corynebacterium]KAB1502384.1 nicotinate-nucleotide adenylyltransferase [Corynebacterium sp. 320]KAB1551394.1 nicotinate-nucleotide adenylyltransferase [Corynebacterium sp. 321]KAB1551777.1 nicotinate-nucleotide adenylyltransferase [Corynebacterium sp. 319]KAB3520936.1 nicotinate-nucleotide adenylyltransferase [Corynebacterium zhongnanshanii]KAB3525991.1 nicotinate-nucleotide adenylyltransferase [Corynebacterium sp. 250]
MRSRIGIMGGTFDPIHNGHLVAGSEVADLFDLDLVYYVPTGQPWQKKSLRVSPAEDRYLMTVIATASNPRFETSRVDIDREGDTFTIDTLRDIRAIHPDAELFFITGADALDKIVTWRDWENMFDLANFIGVTRPGYELPTVDPNDPDAPETPLHHELREGRLRLVEIPAMAISSTDIRQRAAEGRPVWYLVPDGVVQYIAKHGMYSTR